MQKKAKAGDKATVEPFEEAPDVGASNVVDLSELLRQSLGAKNKGGRAAASASATIEAKKTSVKKAPAKKTAGGTAKAKKAA